MNLSHPQIRESVDHEVDPPSRVFLWSVKCDHTPNLCMEDGDKISNRERVACVASSSLITWYKTIDERERVLICVQKPPKSNSRIFYLNITFRYGFATAHTKLI